MSYVELKSVRKRFGDTEIIHGIDLGIEKEEFTVFVGPSGCGKSTLLRMIAGLEDLQDGSIHIGGTRVDQLQPAERGIAMVFQNYALYPHMSVYDNMAYGLKIAKVPKAEIDQRVNKAAKILELGELLQRKPRQLSGGQRQRVAMGRAIVRQPQVFLFDEPLSNLDAKLRAQTRLEIQKLHHELGITSLFVTHDQVEAMTLAERMLVMKAGRVEQIGTPEQVYLTPASTFVAGFIGSPPMNLIHGQAEAGVFRVGGDALALPTPTPRDGPLILGLRPEHAQPAEDGAGWQLQVDVVEMLGAERLVYGRLGDAPFTLRLDGTLPAPMPGSRLPLQAPAARLHWFDTDSGRRL